MSYDCFTPKVKTLSTYQATENNIVEDFNLHLYCSCCCFVFLSALLQVLIARTVLIDT